MRGVAASYGQATAPGSGDAGNEAVLALLLLEPFFQPFDPSVAGVELLVSDDVLVERDGGLVKTRIWF